MGQAWPKRVCQSNSVGIWFMKTSIGFLYLFTIIELDSNGIIGLDSNGIEITSKLELVMMYITRALASHAFVTAQNAVLIIASIGRDVSAQKSDAIITIILTTNVVIPKSGDVSLDCSIVISINSDRNHRRTVTCRRCKIINYFISSLDELDHLWSSCRNLNDNSSTKPIVWPVIQLVPTMDQMLAGPGTK